MTAITDLLQDVAQVVRRCPEPTLTQSILRAARIFCTETRWLRREATFDTVAEQDRYELLLATGENDLEVIGARLIRINDPTAPMGRTQIGPSSPTVWNVNAASGRPYTYGYVPEAMVDLFPTPDGVYTGTVVAQVTPTRTASTLPVDLLAKWEYALIDGATEYLLKIPGQAWTNPALARQEYGMKFRAAINNARADEQRDYNTGTVVARIPKRF